MIALIALAVATTATAPVGPDRLFRCTLGRVTNMAATSPAELGIVGAYKVVLLQPDAAIEYADQPPRGPAGARAVRLHDPDRVLAASAATTITDDWPRKIEVLSLLPQRRRGFLTIGGIDLDALTATGSAGVIDDASETIVAGSFLQGACTVEVAPRLGRAFDTLQDTRR